MEKLALRELEVWDAASSDARLTIAQKMAGSLGPTFPFEQLTEQSLGGQTHEIAFYRFRGSRFALLPGQSSALLGYDRMQPFRPSARQVTDWMVWQEEFGVNIHEYLDECTTPLRRAHIDPILCDVEPRGHVYDQDGAGRLGDYAKVVASCGDGFRLPTADEWEYVCAAGTRSLFRWGDDCPSSSSYHETGWDLHRLSNAFGLLMNADTYQLEFCAEGKFRGGDGGGAVHGGIGKLVTWLPLASSFCVHDEEVNDWCIEEVLVRRVRTVNVG